MAKGMYQEMLKKGLCPCCGKRVPTTGNLCDKCREQRKLQARRYYKRHRQHILSKRKERFEAAAEARALAQKASWEASIELGELPSAPSEEWLRARVALLESKLGASAA